LLQRLQILSLQQLGDGNSVKRSNHWEVYLPCYHRTQADASLLNPSQTGRHSIDLPTPAPGDEWLS